MSQKLQILTRRKMRFPASNKATKINSPMRQCTNKSVVEVNPALQTRSESANFKHAPLKNEILKEVCMGERTRNTELVTSLDNSICVLDLKSSRKSKTQLDGRYKSVRPTTAGGFNFRKMRPNLSMNLRPASPKKPINVKSPDNCTTFNRTSGQVTMTQSQ